jgi:hypothetical protein
MTIIENHNPNIHAYYGYWRGEDDKDSTYFIYRFPIIGYRVEDSEAIVLLDDGRIGSAVGSIYTGEYPGKEVLLRQASCFEEVDESEINLVLENSLILSMVMEKKNVLLSEIAGKTEEGLVANKSCKSN